MLQIENNCVVSAVSENIVLTIRYYFFRSTKRLAQPKKKIISKTFADFVKP